MGQAAPAVFENSAFSALAAKSGTEFPRYREVKAADADVRNLGGTTGFSVPLFGVEKPYLFPGVSQASWISNREG